MQSPQKEAVTEPQKDPGPTPIQFGRPWIEDDDRAAVLEALHSDWILNGPKVRGFEQAFVDLTGAKHAVAVTSCTAGMHIGLNALGVGPGDEVIVPPFSFAANGVAILQSGATPRFVDVDLETQNIDPTKIEAAITDQTKAIMVLHYAGLPVDMDPVMVVARKHDLKVIEDSAHCLGATYKGRAVGNLGDATVFSFGPLKMIVTAGMGGMVTVRSDDAEEALRKLVSYGMGKSMWDRKTDQRPWHYGVPVLGHNFRLTDVAAAMGLSQLKKLDRIVGRRESLAKLYDAELGKIDGILVPPRPEHSERTYLYYVIRVDAHKFGKTRDELALKLQEKGVKVSVHWDPALHLHELYRPYSSGEGAFPVSERLSTEVLSLPMHPTLTEDEVRRVAEHIEGIRAGKRNQ